MQAMIGTWHMCLDGVRGGLECMARGASLREGIAHAIMQVENNPDYVSVGFGGLPARDGRVLLDAAYMDGSTMRMGGIMAAENIQNPILAAQALCGRETNCLLAGRGAEQFAVQAGLSLRDMRTPRCTERWRKALAEEKDLAPLEAYRGHDTVCVVALDDSGKMAVGTSTSGLFMKEPGRVGDSPVIGSGFYCDSRFGGAAATGLGEDIMRGCLSYEIVSLMRRGMRPQEACDEALLTLSRRKVALGEDAGSISVIALSPSGEFGASTTLPLFPFAAGTGANARMFAARYQNGAVKVSPASEEELTGVD